MSSDIERALRVHEAIELLHRVARTHHRSIEKRLDCGGLHRSQLKLLMYLTDNDQPHSQREIADVFDISPACVARSLKALAADGYVTRTGDSDDLRRNNVCIAEPGRQAVAEARRCFDRFDQSVFEGFDDASLSELTELLERLRQKLLALDDTEEEIFKNHSEGSVPH